MFTGHVLATTCRAQSDRSPGKPQVYAQPFPLTTLPLHFPSYVSPNPLWSFPCPAFPPPRKHPIIILTESHRPSLLHGKFHPVLETRFLLLSTKNLVAQQATTPSVFVVFWGGSFSGWVMTSDSLRRSRSGYSVVIFQLTRVPLPQIIPLTLVTSLSL